MTIYDILLFVGKDFPRAITAKSRIRGIYSLGKYFFTDANYLPSDVQIVL